MPQYTASVPADGLVKPEIVRFYERFYEVSDTPSGHEDYANMFTKSGKIIIGANAATGKDEIIKMRHGMWEKVAKRAHSIYKLYPFGASADEVMMYGAVDYEFKTGEKTSTDWAGRAHFSQEDGQLKMNYYQVYLTPRN